MKPTLQLRLGQQLTLTPQLRLAIRLLQLSAADLEVEINQAVDSNPLLEREEDEPLHVFTCLPKRPPASRRGPRR